MGFPETHLADEDDGYTPIPGSGVVPVDPNAEKAAEGTPVPSSAVVMRPGPVNMDAVMATPESREAAARAIADTYFSRGDEYLKTLVEGDFRPTIGADGGKVPHPVIKRAAELMNERSLEKAKATIDESRSIREKAAEAHGMIGELQKGLIAKLRPAGLPGNDPVSPPSKRLGSGER